VWYFFFTKMPELPEVETIARGLRAPLGGRRIMGVRLGKTDFMEEPARLLRELPGSQIAEVRRYGKYLLLDLEVMGQCRSLPPDDRACLLLHLGMTGQLTLGDPAGPVARHTHLRMALDDGRELRLNDVRRFGSVRLLGPAELESWLARLGLDPLEAREEDFSELLGRSRARIKALLLDQGRIRGLGNIYTDESLWSARIHPARRAASLSRSEAHRLWKAIRSVLTQAIRLRGSSVANYVDAQGQPGEYQRRHRVYGRQGKRCARCGSTILRIAIAGRSSCFCPRCQPLVGRAGRNAR
jgi:formamidopyrimidine-DNA glycosylase